MNYVMWFKELSKKQKIISIMNKSVIGKYRITYVWDQYNQRQVYDNPRHLLIIS